jgi:uncharacterized protein
MDGDMTDVDAPVAAAAAAAVKSGDHAALRRLLADHPELATARVDGPRTLLHVLTDFPGHFPGGTETLALLLEAGADVNVQFFGPHEETPLHWAVSTDDVAMVDALLDAGADIEAPGSVVGGGPPMADATAFAQWNAGLRLVERGASTTLFAAAALGLLDRVRQYFAPPGPEPDEVSGALWAACHGGRLETARYLVERGADVNWTPPWEPLTPLDAAARAKADALVAWLREHGGHEGSGE